MKYFLFVTCMIFSCCITGQFAFAQSAQDQLKQMRSTVIEKTDGKDYYIHTVRRGQTLYMISKAYGVEVNDIIRDNPQVKEGIRADEKLRILVPGQKNSAAPKPATARDKATPAKETRPQSKELPAKADSSVVVDLPCGKDTTTKKTIYNVALMLPLFLGEVDQIAAGNPDPKSLESLKSFQFLPYYEGFMLALDSLAKTGLKIKLYVYDADRDTSKTKQLLKKPEMRSMDIIFGLLYHSNFQIVAAFARKYRISLVNPISERSELVTGNPYIFKVQPPKKSQIKELAAYMSATFQGGQVIVIRNGQYSDADAPERLKKECMERNLAVQVVEGQGAAILKYSKDKPNYLVVFSDNQAYVLDLLRELYKIRNEYNLTLVGMPNWPSIDGMENEYLVALKVHMMSRSFIDYDHSAVKHFVQQYQEKYKADPELLAFQGFDQSFYFLSALYTYGTNFGRCIGEVKIQPMVSRFEFNHARNNGFENQRWIIHKYENYRLVPVN